MAPLKSSISLLLVAVAVASGHLYGSVCYDDLGCITLDPSWIDLINRPVNVMPLERSRINTTFLLRTREQPDQDAVLRATDTTTISQSTFQGGRPTKFIVHGFLNTGFDSWVQEMSAALLEHGDYNVISVDWSGGSMPPYTQATANTRLVGREIALLVNTLVAEFGASAGDVHLIGHSLGAHTSGYAGQNITGLGRITGMDPAGPYFQWMPTFVRLDPSDATLVDIIHSNGVANFALGGWGSSQPMGHLDFYPNGGAHQPGCPAVELPAGLSIDDIVDFGTGLVACSHGRAYDLFTESLRSPVRPVAYECPSYHDFQQGECYKCGGDNLSCAPLGIDADLYPTRSRTNVALYTGTTSDAPYYQSYTRIAVKLASPSRARPFVNGRLDLTLNEDGGRSLKEPLTNTFDGSHLTHGQTEVRLIVKPTAVGPVKQVILNWQYVVSALDPLSVCFMCNKHLYVESVKVTEMNTYPQTQNKFCPPNGVEYADMDTDSDQSFSVLC